MDELGGQAGMALAGVLGHKNGPQLLARWTLAVNQSTVLVLLLFEDSCSHTGSSCQLDLLSSKVSPPC